MRRSGNMNDLGSILRRVLMRSGLREEVMEVDIVRAFPKLFPGLIAQSAKPISFKNGRLYLKVSNSVVRQELKMRERELLKKIENHLGQRSVERIMFV